MTQLLRQNCCSCFRDNVSQTLTTNLNWFTEQSQHFKVLFYILTAVIPNLLAILLVLFHQLQYYHLINITSILAARGLSCFTPPAWDQHICSKENLLEYRLQNLQLSQKIQVLTIRKANSRVNDIHEAVHPYRLQ